MQNVMMTYMSRYLGGQVIGCIIFPPYTETFGRKPTYIVSSLVYGLANIIVGTPGNLASIIFGRLLCGILSAIPTVVTAGSLEEIWSPHERIWAIQAWVSAFLVGLAISPAITTAIGASTLGWYVSSNLKHLTILTHYQEMGIPLISRYNGRKQHSLRLYTRKPPHPYFAQGNATFGPKAQVRPPSLINQTQRPRTGPTNIHPNQPSSAYQPLLH